MTHLENGYISKEKQWSVGENKGRSEALFIFSRDVNWCDHCEILYGDISKIKN